MGDAELFGPAPSLSNPGTCVAADTLPLETL
jgi:hypothetical protein